MNSIIDLNTPGNVNYNLQSSYAIAFGNSAGNATANVDVYNSSQTQKQIAITTLTSSVRDVLIDFNFASNVIANVVYSGPTSTLGVIQTGPVSWRLLGVRTIANYNEAFANTFVRDANIANTYSYTTTVNDQFGNTRSWSTTVNVRPRPTIATTGNVLYNEDSTANVTQITLTANAATTSTYTLVANTISAYGKLTNGTSTGQSVEISGNIATIQSAVTAGNLRFDPVADFAANAANAITLQLRTNNYPIANANLNLQIGNSHAEYSLTNAISYINGYANPLTYSITDQDTNVSYELTFGQPAFVEPGPQGENPGRFVINGSAYPQNSNATISGSKATLNAANVGWVPGRNSYGNAVLTYTQVKTDSDGIKYVQADQVPITATLANVSFANVTTSLSYNENYEFTVPFDITDSYTGANSYTVLFDVTQPNNYTTYPLVMTNNGVPMGNYGASAFVLTGNASAINSANIKVLPPVDYTGNITLKYTQYADTQYGNVIQVPLPTGSDVVIQANIANTYSFANVPTSMTYQEDSFTDLTWTPNPSDWGGVVSVAPYHFFKATQISPDPATYAPNWWWSTANIGPGGNTQVSVYNGFTGRQASTGNIAPERSIADEEIYPIIFKYVPPMHYRGNITLRLEQWCTSNAINDGQQVTIDLPVPPLGITKQQYASNLVLTVTGTDDEITSPADIYWTGSNSPTLSSLPTPLAIVDPDPANEKTYTVTLDIVGPVGFRLATGAGWNDANIYYSTSNIGNAVQVNNHIGNVYLQFTATANATLNFSVQQIAPISNVIASGSIPVGRTS
jgi:hypothetical protein